MSISLLEESRLDASSKSVKVPKKRSKLSKNQFSFTPPKGFKPGSYGDLFLEPASISGVQEGHVGLKLTHAHVVWEYAGDRMFQVGQELSLGSAKGDDNDPEKQAGSNYSFNTYYTDHNIAFYGRANTEGVVFSKIIANGKVLTGTLEFQVGGPHEACVVDVQHKGPSYHVSLNWRSYGIFGFEFLQSVSKRLAIGGSLTHNSPNALNIWNLGFKYFPGTGRKSSYFVGDISPIMGSLNLAYVNKPHEQLALASEFKFQPTQEGIKSECRVSAQLLTKMGMLKVSATGSGQIGSFINFPLFNTPILCQLSSQMDFYRNTHNFGLGFQLNI